MNYCKAEYTAVLYHISYPNPESLRDTLNSALSFYLDSNDKTYVVFYLYDSGYIKMVGGTISEESNGTYQLSDTICRYLQGFEWNNTENLSLYDVFDVVSSNMANR